MPSQPQRIGVRVDDYKVDVKRGLRLAGTQGFFGVEVAADGAEVSPQNLSQSGRRHLARLVASQGLSFAALGSAARGAGLADPALVDALVGRMSQTMRLAADMGVRVVSLDVGCCVSPDGEPEAGAVEALRALAGEADRVGTICAVRAGTGDPTVLARVVRELGCPALRIGVDPGALLMGGYDPVQFLATCGDQVSMAYVRDAQPGGGGRGGEEMALGHGGLDLQAYLAGLVASSYAGLPIIHRARTLRPAEEIAADRAYLAARLLA